jgi:hypothetical protein
MRGSPAWPLLLLFAACSGSETAADAAVDARPIDAPPPIDAPRLVTLNQTDSQIVRQGGSVACTQQGTPPVTRENSYYRVFPLDGWALDRPFTPLHVDFGVEQAQSSVGSQTVTVKLYTLEGDFMLANLTMVSTNDVTVPNSGITMLSVPIEPAPSIPPHSTLVAEVLSPDGTQNMSVFYIGANNIGQSVPGYLRAPDCGIAEPITYPDINFPMVHLVLSVTGTY